MSIYNVNKICHLVVHDPSFRKRMQEDPAKAIADFRLTDEERKALLEGDVGRLCRLGAHSFLLGHLQRFGLVGLTMELHVQRIRTARTT